jgi:hypothetical protein
MNTGSSIFMLVGSTLFLICFGLPLFICPMVWARRIGWKIPEEKDLANYLGRALGGIILPVIIMGYLAAKSPWEYRWVFTMVILIGIFQTLVHLYGFIKKSQPLIEHLEIFLYTALSLVTWYFYPSPPL